VLFDEPNPLLASFRDEEHRAKSLVLSRFQERTSGRSSLAPRTQDVPIDGPRLEYFRGAAARPSSANFTAPVGVVLAELSGVEKRDDLDDYAEAEDRYVFGVSVSF